MALGIGEVTQGMSLMGTQQFVSDLNSSAITQTCTLLRDIEGIRSAMEAGWQGQAELNFMTNLQNAVEQTAAGLESLQGTLEGEFGAIQEAWANHDKDVVQID